MYSYSQIPKADSPKNELLYVFYHKVFFLEKKTQQWNDCGKQKRGGVPKKLVIGEWYIGMSANPEVLRNSFEVGEIPVLYWDTTERAYCEVCLSVCRVCVK